MGSTYSLAGGHWFLICGHLFSLLLYFALWGSALLHTVAQRSVTLSFLQSRVFRFSLITFILTNCFLLLRIWLIRFIITSFLLISIHVNYSGAFSKTIFIDLIKRIKCLSDISVWLKSEVWAQTCSLFYNSFKYHRLSRCSQGSENIQKAFTTM